MKTWILIITLFGNDFVGGGIHEEATIQSVYFKSKATCMYAGTTYVEAQQASGVNNKINFICVPQ